MTLQTHNVILRIAAPLGLAALVAWPAARLALAEPSSGPTPAEVVPAGPVEGEQATDEPRGGGPHLDPTRIEGMAICIDCHRAEVTHWMANWRESEHGWLGYSRLLGARAEELAEDLEIDKDSITKDSMCLECHATPALNFHGRKSPVFGVTCEACHGEAGGTEGWLNSHAVYGPRGTSREMETAEHRDYRQARVAAAGQLNSTEVYSLVKRCFDCHVIGDEQLITKTDHQIDDRSFTDFVAQITDDKIRHNFHMNQGESTEVSSLWMDPLWNPQRQEDAEESTETRKKMYYVASVFARAEIVLRLLAKAEDPLGDYAADLGSLLDTGDLEDIFDSIEFDEEDEELAAELIERIEELELEDTGGDTDGDEQLSQEEIQALNGVADAVALVGKKLTQGDGELLTEVELP